MMILVGILIFSLTGCAETAKDDEPVSDPVFEMPELIEEEDDPIELSIEPIETPEITAEPEPTKEIKIDFQEQSYTFKDEEGYEFEITVKVGPWILQSNSELINAAWDEVGQGKELPTISSLGISDSHIDSSRCERRFSDYICFSCKKSNFDMYYAVGTIEIRNITSGFSLSENNTRDVSLYFDSDSFYDPKDYTLPAMCRTYFSTPTDSASQVSWRYIKAGTALVNSDRWGPAAFVLMHGESYSPNNPEGVYRESLESPLRFSHWQLQHDVISGKEIIKVPEEYVLTFPMTVLEESTSEES